MEVKIYGLSLIHIWDQGIKHMNAGDYTAAVTSFTKALQQAPGRVRELELDISYYKAAAQYKSGDFGGAIDTYTNLIDYKANADLYICLLYTSRCV